MKVHKENTGTKREIPEAYSELSRASKMELFENILDGFKLQPSRTSEMKFFAKIVNNFPKKVHLRYWIGF